MALDQGQISYLKNALAYYDTIGVTENILIEKVHKEMSIIALVTVTINCLNGTRSLPYQLHEERSSLL
jgi:hypothetical protein